MTPSLTRTAILACCAALAAGCGGGSHAIPAPPSQVAGAFAATPTEPVPESAARGVLVAVHLPLRNSDELDALVQRQGDRNSSEYHHFVTPQQFKERYAPAATDMSAAAGTLRTLGFETHVTTQAILASAPQATVERTFNVQLTPVRPSGRATQSVAQTTTLSPNRAPTLPPALGRLGATVTFAGHVRHIDSLRVSKAAYVPNNRYSTTGPYWFTDLKQAYGYPSVQIASGRGRTIAVVINSDVSDSDMALYFGHEHLAPPAIQRRPVNGGPQSFDPLSVSSGEANLDVQQAYGSAPGAHIMLYGVPSLSDDNVYAAYSAIVDDNRADIVTSSFGLCELYYTKAYTGGVDFTPILTQLHDLFRQGNAQGISFVASSGDNGAFGCADPTFTFLVKGVQNPADDPSVTAVGGTNLITKSTPASRDSTYVRESAFEDPTDPSIGVPNEAFGSGGGVSTIFAKPYFQKLLPSHATMRAIPDVSMHMGGCPGGSVQPCNPDDSSVVEAVGGQFALVIGTSISAPEFAGLLAVTEQTLGTRLGNSNTYVYDLQYIYGDLAYRSRIPGNNGYSTGFAYNFVLGNGTPNAAFFADQPFATRAGIPWSPSNP